MCLRGAWHLGRHIKGALEEPQRCHTNLIAPQRCLRAAWKKPWMCLRGPLEVPEESQVHPRQMCLGCALDVPSRCLRGASEVCSVT